MKNQFAVAFATALVAISGIATAADAVGPCADGKCSYTNFTTDDTFTTQSWYGPDNQIVGTVKDVTISGSTFNSGSAGYFKFGGSQNIVIENSTFSDSTNTAIFFNGHNKAQNAATAENLSASAIQLTNVNFVNNNSSDSELPSGAALYLYGKADLTMTGGSFRGNTVTPGSSYDDQAFGGAAVIKSGNVVFENVDFDNNVVTAENGYATGGAILVDKTTGIKDNGADLVGDVTFKITQNGLTYSSNNVIGKADSYVDTYGWYASTSGGFLFLDRSSRGTFDIADGVTLTIGEAGADYETSPELDSIASALPNNNTVNPAYSTLTKTGAGTVQMNASMDKYFGYFNVDEGSFNLAQEWHNRAKTTVNGGTLNAADGIVLDNLKAVKNNYVHTGTLTVEAGRVVAPSITFKNTADAATADQATLTINGGSVETTALDTTNGQVSLSGGSLQVAGKLTVAANTFAMNGGELVTSYTNFFEQQGEGDGATLTGNANLTNIKSDSAAGTVVFIDDIGSYSLDDLRKTQSQFNQPNANSIQIVFQKGALTLGDEENLTENSADGIGGLVLRSITGDAKDGSFVVGANTTVAGLDFGTSATAEIGSSGTATLTLSGANGNLFSGDIVEAESGTVSTKGSVQLGANANDSGHINVKTLSINEGSFDVLGSFTAQAISIAESANATVHGVFDIDSLTGAGTMNVAEGGMLAFNTTDAQITLNSGSVVAIGKYQPDTPTTTPDAGEASISLFSVTTPADGQVNSLIDASAADTLVTVGGGSEAAFQNALANAGVEYDAEQNAGIYFADTLKLDSNGKVQIGVLTQAVAEGEVAVGAAGIVVIDSHRFMNTADYVIDGAARFASAAQIVLDGLNSTGDIKLSKTWNSTGTNVTFVDGNAFFNETLTANVDSDPSAVINVATNEAAFAGDAETYKLVDSMLAPTADEGIRNVVTAIGREDGAFINEGKLTDDGFRALDETFAMPVTAGTYNVAYDAAEQVTGTVQRRNLEPSTGLGVWADVFYSTNEAKSIYGGQGYSADIYGGTIGFDGTFSCGAKLGLALSVGSGDADSEKSVGKYSNDADFYGVTVYTGKDIAGLYFSADASYLWLDNDISGQVAGASVKDSIDSNVFTVGVRADMTVYDQSFKVVPHVGMRYTNIDVDNYRGIESDSMNVFEMPIGVKVAGDFEPAAGWKLTPSFDFTVVPQVGDKNVSTLVGDIDVLDNLYNSTLGVNATYGNFAFGLSYRYGFGNDDRSNNAFQARASYQF